MFGSVVFRGCLSLQSQCLICCAVAGGLWALSFSCPEVLNLAGVVIE